jgi:hypothetical protein
VAAQASGVGYLAARSQGCNLTGIQAGMLLPGHGDPRTGGVEDAIRRARAAGPP